MSARICVAALLAARALAAALALAPLSTSRSADLDLHRHWDQRCKDCHGHAADFARRFLRVENGRLAGAHHRDDLGLFLRNHYLTDELVPPVMAMLQAQANTPPLFSEKCLRCHGTAAEFARRSLVVKDGCCTARRAAAG
jgi:hypothetical protein